MSALFCLKLTIFKMIIKTQLQKTALIRGDISRSTISNVIVGKVKK